MGANYRFRRPEQIREAEERIIDTLTKNPWIHSHDIIKILNGNPDTVRCDLNHMGGRGQIVKKRAGRGWVWCVNNEYVPSTRSLRDDDLLPVKRTRVSQYAPVILPKCTDPWDWMMHHLIGKIELGVRR